VRTVAAAALLLVATPAWAVDPFEIQVYDGAINRPLEAGLELHTNFTAQGRTMAEYPDEITPDKLLRTTLEPSLGLLEWWELGAYLQFAFDPNGPAEHWAGFKLRSKWVVPRRHTGDFLLGLNVELGRGVARLGGAYWDTELRPIIAWERGHWLLAVNPILGWVLSGPDTHAAPEFEPAAKVRWDTGHHVGVGLEYYAGFGALSDVPAVAHQEHVLYAAGDLIDGPVELNVAVGHGLTAATDDWTIKTIVGVGF
jgi:hypothetical protein